MIWEDENGDWKSTKDIIQHLERSDTRSQSTQPQDKSPPQIKPCPFCGLKVEITFTRGDWGYTPDAVSIRCASCGIGFREDAEAWERGKGTHCIREQAEAKLIDKWNTRAETRPEK